jgi:hypothetical protein
LGNQNIKVDEHRWNDCGQKAARINKVDGFGLSVFSKKKQKKHKRADPQQQVIKYYCVADIHFFY